MDVLFNLEMYQIIAERNVLNEKITVKYQDCFMSQPTITHVLQLQQINAVLTCAVFCDS